MFCFRKQYVWFRQNKKNSIALWCLWSSEKRRFGDVLKCKLMKSTLLSFGCALKSTVCSETQRLIHHRLLCQHRHLPILIFKNRGESHWLLWCLCLGYVTSCIWFMLVCSRDSNVVFVKYSICCAWLLRILVNTLQLCFNW